MNEYTAIQITRNEYEQRNRSLTPVSEFGQNVREAEPGWVSKQATHLLHLLGSGWAALGKRMAERSKMPKNELKPGAWQRLGQ